MRHLSTTTITQKFLRFSRRGALLLALLALLRPLGASAQAVVSTLAGGGTTGRLVGSTDGTGAAALFNYPNGVAVDGAGNVYVADLSSHKIRKVSAAGMVTTLAGGGANGITSGSTDDTGTAALFNYPNGLAVDGAGNVYVADLFNNRIRMVSAGAPLAATSARPVAAEVALYPNPARSSFTVQLPAGLAPSPAELLNSLGQVVRRPAAAAPRFTVETAGLAPGIYTLRLALGAAGTVARRVVVE